MSIIFSFSSEGIFPSMNFQGVNNLQEAGHVYFTIRPLVFGTDLERP